MEHLIEEEKINQILRPYAKYSIDDSGKEYLHIKAVKSAMGVLIMEVSDELYNLKNHNIAIIQDLKDQRVQLKEFNEENKQLKEILDLAQAELRAMYKRVGINGSNVLDLIDSKIESRSKTT